MLLGFPTVSARAMTRSDRLMGRGGPCTPQTEAERVSIAGPKSHPHEEGTVRGDELAGSGGRRLGVGTRRTPLPAAV